MQNILITGGSGIIGRELCKQLSDKKYEIRVLGRKKNRMDENSLFSYYYWNVDEGFMETGAIQNINYIIHLAGENISEKRWTPNQKQIIENSRVKSAELLYKVCSENNIWPNAFISSSAIGYYGTYTSEQIHREEDAPGKDFLAKVCEKWEKSADLFANKGIRTVKIRTGVVLSINGGIYPTIAALSKKGIASAIGSGNQFVPWIHIDDIVKLFITAVENEQMEGIYNGVAPQYITNTEFVKAVAKSLNKSVFLPKVPAFALKAMYGEMSEIMLKGSRVSSEKIIKHGFNFNFPEIERALINLTNS